MPSLPTWLRSHPWRAAALAGAAVVLVVVLPAVLQPRSPVTRANFQRIQVGAFQAEVLALLGPPGYESLESGSVAGPEAFLIDVGRGDEGRAGREFRLYHLRAWTSPRLTIVVVSDGEGRVVCRYCVEALRPDWLARLRSWLP